MFLRRRTICIYVLFSLLEDVEMQTLQLLEILTRICLQKYLSNPYSYLQLPSKWADKKDKPMAHLLQLLWRVDEESSTTVGPCWRGLGGFLDRDGGGLLLLVEVDIGFAKQGKRVGISQMKT
ncbi:hypothetical protein Adt_21300 [Abeliophyllum distichum]|uniref:Uncharacterized protein n=1 Tax=Abeliophyllum distichum TaxID=126358 RepID=A0ABD1SZ18_9LAMI